MSTSLGESELTNEFAGDALRESLVAFIGEADPHQRIASGRALAKQFGISLNTTRTVIDGLVEAGLVYRVHGKGTFVAPPQVEVTQNTLLVAYVEGSLEHFFFGRMFEGVVQAAEDEGYTLEVHQIRTQPDPRYRESKEFLIRSLQREDLLGMVLPWADEELYGAITRMGVQRKVVVTMSPKPGQELASVILDQRAIAAMGADWLKGQGCRQPVIVYQDEPFLAGAHEVWAEGPVPLKFARPVDVPAFSRELLALGADGILFSDDRLAREALQVLEALEPGYLEKTPVVSQASEGEGILPPRVARLEVDGARVGRAAVSALRSARETDAFGNVEIRIRPTLRASEQ